jgi:hypothetical protein
MIQIIGQATQSDGGSPSWTLTGVCKSAARTGTGTYTVTLDYLEALGVDSKDKLTILISAERGGLGTERYILDWTSTNTFRVRNYTARNNQTLGDCMLTITILADVNPIRLGFSGNTLVLPKYKFFDVTTADGFIEASNPAGYPGELNVMTGVPATDAYKCSGFGITGAALTGNEFKYENRNVSAEALFEHSKDLTLVPNDHATLSADKMTGFSGDIVTVNAIPDEGWYFTGMNITGATLTGNKFMFVGENVTAEGLYTDEGFPIVYENDGHGTLTGDTNIGIPGQPINLTTAYNTYYRFSGYDVTGGYVEDGKLYATAACTARAVYKPNKFTITGNYNYGQVTYTASWDAKVRSIDGDGVPTSWGTVGNNFNPGSCSAYGFTYRTQVGAWFERGTGNLWLNHYIGNTMTKSANANGYQGYTPYTLTCTLTGTSTLTGHPKLSARMSCSYNKNTNGMPTNAWTATGYLP